MMSGPFLPRWGAILAMAVVLGCGGGSDSPAGPGDPGPDPDPDPPPEAGRTFRMGFAPSIPRPSQDLFFQVVADMREVAGVAIVQQPVPWGDLLDGTRTFEEAVADRVEVLEFLRANGFRLVYLLDPLDGLDRTREPPELVARGRSIAEPEIRDTHERWAMAIAERVGPAWYGLASEINTLAGHSDLELYDELVDLVDELAPRIRVASPGTKVFVSFQVEDARGTPPFPPSQVDHFELIDDFDVDALGLSSYPAFVFDTPAEIPDDHYAIFDLETDLPLLVVEGGWPSGTGSGVSGTPQEQAAWVRRSAELLNGIDARLWLLLLYADLDVPALGLPPERAQGLSNFATMGLVDTKLDPKPAFTAWQEIFARPVNAP